jgi:tetratricopeptide (TPR) repeat protein
MNRKQQENKTKPPSSSRRRKVAVGLLVLLVVASVTLYIKRSSLGLWAARQSLNKNAPHEALSWLDWSDQQGGDKNPENRLFEALVQNRLGFAEGGEIAVSEAERLGATVAQLEDHLDLIQASLGDTQAAARLSENETASVPVREFFYSVVRCAMHRGNLGWGHALLDRWREQLPNDAAERYLRGRIFELQDEYSKAAECYEQAFERQGTYPEAAFRLGILRRYQREYDKAEKSFRLCLDSPYEEIARIEIAECLLAQGEAKQAAKILNSVLDLPVEKTLKQYLPVEVFVEDDRAAIVGATLKENLKEREEAARLYARALEHNPRNIQVRSQLSTLLRILKREPEADEHAAILGQLTALQAETRKIHDQLLRTPDDLDLRCDLAELHLQCTSLANAQLELQRVFDKHPDHLRANAILRRIQSASRQ